VAALFLVLMLVVVLRLWPFCIWPGFGCSDGSFHLWRCLEIENNDYRIPAWNGQFILGGRTCYPPLLHYMMLLFPRNSRERWAPLISPAFDLLALGIFFVVYRSGIWITSTRDFIFGIACYFLSPALLQFQASSVYSLKARSMGRFFLLCSFVLFYIYHTTGLHLCLAMSALIFALMLLSSKFAVQTSIFTIPLIAIRFPMVLVVPAAGFVLAVVLSGGFYLSVLREHIVHQKMYFTKMRHYGSASSIDRSADIRLLIDVRNLFRQPLTYATKWIYRVTVTRLLCVAPEFFVFGGLLLTNRTRLQASGDPVEFAVLWLFGCILGTVVSTWVKSLGEPERYLEYAVFPLVMLLLQSDLPGRLPLVGVLAFYLLFYCISNSRDLWRLFEGSSSQLQVASYAELKQYLARSAARRILFVPMKLALEFADDHRHKYLWASPFIEPYVCAEFWDTVFRKNRFPFPRSLPQLTHDYEIDIIAVHQTAMTEYRDQLAEVDAGFMFQSGNLYVYEIRKPGNHVNE